VTVDERLRGVWFEPAPADAVPEHVWTGVGRALRAARALGASVPPTTVVIWYRDSGWHETPTLGVTLFDGLMPPVFGLGLRLTRDAAALAETVGHECYHVCHGRDERGAYRFGARVRAACGFSPPVRLIEDPLVAALMPTAA
jgi:hypothetical protein